MLYISFCYILFYYHQILEYFKNHFVSRATDYLQTNIYLYYFKILLNFREIFQFICYAFFLQSLSQLLTSDWRKASQKLLASKNSPQF
jgi:hypothetical protein